MFLKWEQLVAYLIGKAVLQQDLDLTLNLFQIPSLFLDTLRLQLNNYMLFSLIGWLFSIQGFMFNSLKQPNLDLFLQEKEIEMLSYKFPSKEEHFHRLQLLFHFWLVSHSVNRTILFLKESKLQQRNQLQLM